GQALDELEVLGDQGHGPARQVELASRLSRVVLKVGLVNRRRSSSGSMPPSARVCWRCRNLQPTASPITIAAIGSGCRPLPASSLRPYTVGRGAPQRAGDAA